jgi:hypothetical protein
MVLVATSTTFNAVVNVWRSNGDVHILGELESDASDVFDYATQAQGYFRWAIQTMDARKIEIEIRLGNQLIELKEITRD